MDPSKMTDPKEDLETDPSHNEVVYDDVFGEVTEYGPNYRNVHITTLV